MNKRCVMNPPIPHLYVKGNVSVYDKEGNLLETKSDFCITDQQQELFAPYYDGENRDWSVNKVSCVFGKGNQDSLKQAGFNISSGGVWSGITGRNFQDKICQDGKFVSETQ